MHKVKVTYCLRGPNQSWELIKERVPAIPSLCILNKDISHQFQTIYQGTSHTSPSKDTDVQHLEEHYRQAQIHVYTPGQHITNAVDKVKEFISDGYYTAYTKIIPKWIACRAPYECAMLQEWLATSDGMPSSNRATTGATSGS